MNIFIFFFFMIILSHWRLNEMNNNSMFHSFWLSIFYNLSYFIFYDLSWWI